MQWLLEILRQERGEFGEGANEETATDLSNTPEEASPETETSQGGLDSDSESAIPEAQRQAQQAVEETFLTGSTLDPTKLPPEVQPIFKRMQGAYTKKMQDAASLRERASIVDRFYGDKQFAFQTLAQWAAQNGYQVLPAGQQAQAAQVQQGMQGQRPRGQAANAANDIIEAVKSNLPEELHWMADSQANAIQTAVQNILAPVVNALTENHQRQNQLHAEQEWDRLAAELTEKAPGWEQYEDTMGELHDFLSSPALTHPKFGSKHQILFDLATRNAASQADVARRMNQAARNRPSSGIQTGRTTSNWTDRIKSAKSSQDAFQLAIQAAENAGK